jgi:protein-S-isoprenylcysteine O-methyltransferase Ste14
VSPFLVSGAIFAAWVVSWFVAALWSRRTVARPPPRSRALDLGLTLVGTMLLVYSARTREMFGDDLSGPLFWHVPWTLSWALTGLVGFGLCFTWWARLTLGDLWSSAVVRKDDHVIVSRGPYRLVRHPIYTGLIFALLMLALQIGSAAAIAGALLIATGFWLKARLEERFLSVELGPAYADYRRHTPMLIPFLPTGG